MQVSRKQLQELILELILLERKKKRKHPRYRPPRHKGDNPCGKGFAPGAQSGVKTKIGPQSGRRVSNCEKIKVSESKLRKIVRTSLVNESFLSGKSSQLNSVKFKGKEYLAYGFSKTNLFDVNRKSSSSKNAIVVIFNAPKADLPLIIRSGGGQIKTNFKAIESDGASVGEFAPAVGRVVTMFLPVDTPGLTLSEEKTDTGLHSQADIAIEIAGILGGIPVIGEPLDIASGFLALAKDPPDIVLAALTFAFATPVIGTFLAVAKPLLLKSGRKGAKDLAENIVEVAEEAGIEPSVAAASIKKTSLRLIDTSRENIEIFTSSPKTAAHLREGLDDVEEMIEEVVGSMEDIGSFSVPTRLPDGRVGVTQKSVSSETLGTLRTAVREEFSSIVDSLKSGNLSSVVRSAAKRAADISLATGRESMSKSYDEIRRLIDEGETSEEVWREVGSKFLENYESAIIGKTFKLADRTITWNAAGADFATRSMNILLPPPPVPRRIGSDIREIAIQSIDVIGDKETFINSVMNTASPATARKVSEAIIDKISEITIQYTDDPAVLNRPYDFSGFEPGTTKMGDASASMGLDGKLFINLSGDRSVHDLAGTLKHEVLHFMDAQLIAILGLGDKILSRYFKGNLQYASDAFAEASEKLMTVDGKKLSRGAFSNRNLLQVSRTLKSASRDQLRSLKGMVQRIGNRIEARAPVNRALREMGAEQGLPIPQLDYLIDVLIMNDGQSTETVLNAIGYASNPVESFVRFNKLIDFAVNEGYERSRSGLRSFLIEVDLEDITQYAGLDDLDNDYMRFIFDIADQSGADEQDVLESILDYMEMAL